MRATISAMDVWCEEEGKSMRGRRAGAERAAQLLVASGYQVLGKPDSRQLWKVTARRRKAWWHYSTASQRADATPGCLVWLPRLDERGAIMAALRPASRWLPALLGWLAACRAAAALLIIFSWESFR